MDETEAIRLLESLNYTIIPPEPEVEPEDFDLFWNLYKKKVGKVKCMKLWAKLSHKDRMAALAYVPKYTLAQPDQRYRKNPETFLRNKCWNDEIIIYDNPVEQQRQRINQAAGLVAKYAPKNQ